MAQFLLDMGISPKIASFLKGKGHHAVHANDLGFSTAGDRAILEYAISHDLVLLSTDLGFSKLITLEGIVTPGAIIMRLHNPSVEMMLSRLENLLRSASAEDLRETLVIVEPHRLRKRRLPIIPNR